MLRSDDSAFSNGLPFSRLATLAICLSAAALGLGCTPQIGDDCTVSTNCSTTGVRLCDVTQPGGYCTIFNCEPGSCPDNSKCVNFGTQLSAARDDNGNPLTACTPSQANSPYKRSFCMASCSSDSDCRGGYRCRRPSGPDGFNAVLAEHESGAKVCAVPPKAVKTPASTEVCTGSDAGPADDTSSSGGGSGGGSGAGTGGAGDGGGAAGAAEGGASGDGGSGG